VVTIGLEAAELAANFRGCAVAARIDNAASVDNDESGSPVAICKRPRARWSQEWRMLLRLG
jgi:hypothetical protein